MKIERLELYGYNRLTLDNIRHFVYTPTQRYQLILGTNGSGKSSVLHELSPLPGAASDYDKDGYKKVTVTHRGNRYTLTSTFRTGKHSFMGEEELNPGGTAEVQKMLVQQYFGYTREIHELLTGETRFTRMAPGERRKWITAISKVDYNYAMSTFKRVASRSRDQQGALKHLRQRLTQESHNLQSMTDTTGLEEQAQKIHEELNVLMLERIPNLPSLNAQQTRLRQLYDEIELGAKEFFKTLAYMPGGKAYRSNDDVVFDLQRLDSNLQSSQAMLTRMGNEYSDMEAVINSVQMDAGETLENLPELIELQQVENERWRTLPVLFRDLNSPSEIARDWAAIKDEVQTTFRSLPDNQDRRYSNESMSRAKEECRRLSGVIDHAMAKISNLKARIAAMNEAQETQCPSCKYIWRPGYSEEELAEVKRNQLLFGQDVDAAQLKIKELEAFLEEADGFAAQYRRFRGLVQGYPRLQPLWDHILSNQLLLNNPKGNLGLFTQWAADLEANLQLETGVKRLRHYQEVQERQSNMGDTTHFNRRMRLLQEEIATSTEHVLQQRSERVVVEKYFRKLQRMQEVASRLETVHNEVERIRAVLIDSVRNDVIDETVRAHQMEVGGIMRKLSEKEGQEGIVRDLQSSMVDVELDVEAMKLLVQALSPNEGLIAEQLSGDIGCLVAQLNSVIASIWTYDMTVVSCGLETGELDYKFPVRIGSETKLRPDVSKTSKGQQQAIDLAFHLTAMLYLDLTDYPLFLDEPGEGFDEQHRVALISFVKQLMEMNQHSQLFLISHYAASHGSFVGAEVLVLDGRNITVPGEYNTHVVMA